MPQLWALCSVVFMICVVLLFDRVHRAGWMRHFCEDSLMTGQDLDQLRSIMLACEE